MLKKDKQQWQILTNKIIIGNYPPLEEVKITHF